VPVPQQHRALVRAELVGSASPCRCRSPFVSHRITDRYPGGAQLSAPLNKHSPSTKYTTATAGSSRCRFSRQPDSSITSSTSSGVISTVKIPRSTGHAGRLEAASTGAGMTD
jgi:hypothetical protein